MVHRTMQAKALALIVSILTIIVTTPFGIAGTAAAVPLGTVVTNGSVTIGKSVAPTGTTLFAGDQVTSEQPALINFSSGSRIEMTKAAATFVREGSTLVVEASQGLMRFSFNKGEEVRINAGSFQFAGGANSNRIGELGLNKSGEVVLTLAEGSFAALNTANGARTEVNPGSPLMALNSNPGNAAQGAAQIGAGVSGSAGGGAGATAAMIVAGVGFAAGAAVGIQGAVQSSSSR